MSDPLADHHPPSPCYTPGFGPRLLHRGASIDSIRELPKDASPNSSKTYSFVALPGNVVKKRPRRRYDEIERLYHCSFPECNKAYGTLNHLNAHVTMQKHGPKRSPNEFKELRKQWRKAKKESDAGMGLDVRLPVTSPNYPLPSQDPLLVYPSQRYQPPYPLPLETSFPRRYSTSPSEHSPAPYSSHPTRDDYPVSPHDPSWSGYPPSGYSPSYFSPSTPSPSTPTYHHQPLSPVRSASGPIENLPFPFSHHQHQTQLQSYARQERRHYSDARHHHVPHDIDSHSNRSHSHSPHSRLPPDSTLLTPLPGYDSQQSQSAELRYHDSHPGSLEYP